MAKRRNRAIGLHRPGINEERGEYVPGSVSLPKATHIAVSALIVGSASLRYRGVPETTTWGGKRWLFHGGDHRDPSYYTRGEALKIINKLRASGYIAKAFQPLPRGRGLFETGLVIYKRKRTI